MIARVSTGPNHRLGPLHPFNTLCHRVQDAEDVVHKSLGACSVVFLGDNGGVRLAFLHHPPVGTTNVPTGGRGHAIEL